MKSYLSLSIKELKEQKIIAALILTAVILSCIMTTTVSHSLGILQIMRIDQASSLNGNRFATFHEITYAQMLKLKEDPRLYSVGSLINVGSIKLGNSGLTLYTREYLDGALKAYPSLNQLKEGRLPAAPLEIALPENALHYLDSRIQVGDTIKLQAERGFMDGTIPAYEYSAEFTVCGILKGNYIGYSTGVLGAVLGEGTASMLLPENYLLYSTDFKTKNTVQFQSIIDELIDTLGVAESKVQYNWILLDALGISYHEAETSNMDTGFSFMAVAGIMVGALILLAAGLVIYNILKISITKRIREYGTLRAIGGERGQVYRLVTLQLLILCGIGIPIGLLVGALSSKSVLIAATGILNPDLFMADSAEELNNTIRAANSNNVVPFAVSIFISLLFAMLAAFPAARYASHVSPTVAIAGQSIKIKRSSRKVKSIRNFEAYYARLNLKRGRSRTVITILSLVMSITVFVALQSAIALLDTSSNVKDMYLGDYSITNESIGIEPQSVAEIRENESVEHLLTTKLSTYSQNKDRELELDFSLQSWEAFHIAGVDDTRLVSFVDGLTEQDMIDLISGSACIVKNPIAFSYEGQTVDTTNLKTGDMITVNGLKLRVAGITDAAITINNGGFLNGVQIIVTDEAYDRLTGTNRYSEVYPILTSNSDNEQFEQWLDNWCNRNPGSHWLSYQQTNAQLAESFEQINMLCWVLILLIGLIGILNIINTVYSNIHTRISEIGIQRAIGMNIGSLYKTFLWEGAYYGIIASVVGGILGYICTILIDAATTNTLQLVHVPYIPIFEAAFISIAACLLATALPLRTIAKTNIVESIDAMD